MSADSYEDIAAQKGDVIPALEVPPQDLYHAKSFWTRWIFCQDAKVIGIQYSITAIAIGLVALVLSWIMRLQLGFPELVPFLGAAEYYQFVTMHGMIMVIYLLTALFLGGFGNFLIPLMVGARDMVFPYVNMVSYWVYLLAVLVLVASFFVPGGPTGAGWTLYPPQAITSGTPGGDGAGIVLMLISLSIFVVGFTMGGLNYVITVLQARTRGMTLMRMPLTVWGIFTATCLALFAFPALIVSCIMMTLDNLLGTSFFMPAMSTFGEQSDYSGGSPILFQHLFWFFGHPEVYILIIPTFGIISQTISTSISSLLFALQSKILAKTCISFLGTIVWSHHLYTINLEMDTKAYFSTITMLISLPTGTKIFNWLTTFYFNNINLTFTHIFYSFIFLLMFTIGGLTGILLANASIDISLHDTYYVITHFHYILSLGAIITLFIYLLFYSTLLLDYNTFLHIINSTLLYYNFYFTILGINITFTPLHFLGFNSMPRRIPDYPDLIMNWNFL